MCLNKKYVALYLHTEVQPCGSRQLQCVYCVTYFTGYLYDSGLSLSYATLSVAVWLALPQSIDAVFAQRIYSLLTV